MEVFEAIEKRRSIRAYRDTPVTEELFFKDRWGQSFPIADP
jgi:nitroreductase